MKTYLFLSIVSALAVNAAPVLAQESITTTTTVQEYSAPYIVPTPVPVIIEHPSPSVIVTEPVNQTVIIKDRRHHRHHHAMHLGVLGLVRFNLF